LRLCSLTVESSNVFFCSRPVCGPGTSAGAGKDATAFQVLSAVLRSRIERPANGRSRIEHPVNFQAASGSLRALSESPAAAPRRPGQPLASRPELIVCRSTSRTTTRLLLRAKRAQRLSCHSAGRFPAGAVPGPPSVGSPPAGAVLPRPDAGYSSPEQAMVGARCSRGPSLPGPGPGSRLLLSSERSLFRVI
jgi:hypothetical protein